MTIGTEIVTRSSAVKTEWRLGEKGAIGCIDCFVVVVLLPLLLLTSIFIICFA
jgi:hypothetical protein